MTYLQSALTSAATAGLYCVSAWVTWATVAWYSGLLAPAEMLSWAIWNALWAVWASWQLLAVRASLYALWSTDTAERPIRNCAVGDASIWLESCRSWIAFWKSARFLVPLAAL